MITKIIEFSVRNRWLVILAWAGIAALGVFALFHTPVDAIPDLSDNQVIVYANWEGRSPLEMEQQVTYPLSVQLEGLAGVKTVRASSDFGFSLINVIFQDNIDPYFARQRVLERLTLAGGTLPPGVTPQLAPDATALGQIFWYTVEGGGQSLDSLRAIQDFNVRYALAAVPGVAEVGSVGGFQREYHIDVDPAKLRAFNLPLSSIFSAVSASNLNVGGKVLLGGASEYVLRGVGLLDGGQKGVDELDQIPVVWRDGIPVRLKDMATVQLGPAFRRGALEKNGHEAVGGVVIMRFGENPLAVIDRVKAKIRDIQSGLPTGVQIVPFYDRTRLIESAIHTVTGTLREEIIIASIAILLILTHIRSAILVCLTLPMAVGVSFIFMYFLGIPSNIMSLCGIAISIGILVDASVVMVENATHVLKEKFGDEPVTGDITEEVCRACRTVGGPIFFSVLIMLVSFLPVFVFGGQEGRLSHPLAFTKSFAMVGVSLLAITLTPALIPLMVRGRLSSEEKNWIVRNFIEIYRPLLSFVIDRPAIVWWSTGVIVLLGTGFIGQPWVWAMALGLAMLAIILAVKKDGWTFWLLVAALGWIVYTKQTPPDAALRVITVGGAILLLSLIFRHWRTAGLVSLLCVAVIADSRWPKLGSEFMPELDEGAIMDMPITAPRVPMGEAIDDVMVRDRILRTMPEAESVVGKIGRADTATDPSPVDMVETMVDLRPQAQWPKRKLEFADALDQAAAVASMCQQRGWLGGPLLSLETWKTAAKAVDNERLLRERPELVAPAALLDTVAQRAEKRFDSSLRDLASRRELEYQPELARILVAQAFTDLVNHAASLPAENGKPALLRIPTEVDAQAVTAMGDEDGRLLSQMPRQETVDSLLSRLTAQAVSMGVLSQRDDLLLDRPNAFLNAALNVERAIGITTPTFAERTFTKLATLHHHLWEEKIATLNWELHDAGIDVLETSLIEELSASAQTAAWRGHPADKKDLPAVATELAKNAHALLLWHKTRVDLVNEMNGELQMPGWGNIWTQPIINRVNMLANGVRTQIGVKIFGPVGKPLEGENGAIAQAQAFGERIAARLKQVPGAVDVTAEQALGKRYVEVHLDREKAARYGISASDVAEVVETALGGATATTVLEGAQRFDVQVRLAGNNWQDPESIGNVPIAANMMKNGGQQTVLIPLKDVADVTITQGPSMIRSENGRLTNTVTLNVRGRDVIGFVDEAREAIAPIEKEMAGTGQTIVWAGEFENELHARQTLTLIFPVTVMLIGLLLWMTFRDMADVVLVLLAVVGALAGAVAFQGIFGFNFSLIVSIGYIAAFGMATETGVIMLVYLREAVERRGGIAGIPSVAVLRRAVIDGAVHRLRPKLLTEGVAIIGLAPMLWASGTGWQIMRPMAAPVLGGLLISDEVIDLLIPVLFYWLRRRRWEKLHEVMTPEPPPPTTKADEPLTVAIS